MEVEDQIEAAILSFTENLHRLDLDYKDKMNVATRLLGSLGTVKKVAGELGVSEPTVRNYLGYAAVPDEVKELVDRKKLSTRTALEICRQIQDREMAIAVAKKVSESPRREKPRQHLLIAAARENPGKKLAEVERIASKQQYAKVTIHLTPRVAAALEGASKEMDVDPPLLATHAVEEWLTRRGFLS
ncbi:MAG: hypothetical protein FJ276_34030 [Planctomycetes bacterium]|nr:hypothetical protein [Planctomycetota bacterium]